MAADDELVKGTSQAGEVICPFPGCRDELASEACLLALSSFWSALALVSTWAAENSQMAENSRPRNLSPAKHSWAAENSQLAENYRPRNLSPAKHSWAADTEPCAESGIRALALPT